MAQRLPNFIAALWWGSLSTVGLLAVPLLFAHLPTPALAGGMALMRDDGERLIAQGVTSREEVLRVTRD